MTRTKTMIFQATHGQHRTALYPMSVVACIVAVSLLTGFSQRLSAQAGLRASLEKLDKNKNGKIEPDEAPKLGRHPISFP